MGSDETTHGRDGAIREAAAEAYIRCFPLYLTDAVRRAHPMAPAQFHLMRTDIGPLAPGLFEDDPRIVVSSAWIDLSAGPIVLMIPHMHGRHFSLTVMDTAGRCVANLGSRTGDDNGFDLALVAPRWAGEVPAGVRAKRSTSESCWAVSRIHAHSMLDRMDTMALARRQSVASLDDHLALREAAADPLEVSSSGSLQQVLDVSPAQFLQRLGSILERAPLDVQSADQRAVEALVTLIGDSRGPAAWSPDLFEALEKGFADGLNAIRAASRAVYATHGVGWRTMLPTLAPERETAVARAAHAYESLGAPPREDRITFICSADDTGRILAGRNAYRIHLPGDALPPVNDFWRLYTRPAAAAQYRTGIGNRNDLLLNADGSLDLTIQHPLPEFAGIANWLPTSDGEFSLVMSLYSPQPAALKGAWRMPAVERLDPRSREGEHRQRNRGASDGGAPSHELRTPLAENRSFL